jgi:hypothetical protein
VPVDGCRCLPQAPIIATGVHRSDASQRVSLGLVISAGVFHVGLYRDSRLLVAAAEAASIVSIKGA